MAEPRRLVEVRSLLRAGDEPVLPVAMVGPAFGDDYWDLNGADLPARVQPSFCRLDFASIQNDHWRLLAKEYFWARLNVDVLGSTRLPPQCARAEFSILYTFVRWVLDPAAHPVGFDGRLSGLDHAQLDGYAEGLRDGRSAGTVGLYLRVVERLDDYSDFLSHDRFTVRPWRLRTPTRVAGYVHEGPNKTLRIPQEVLGPFLHWALLYVEVASADILSGLGELSALRQDQASLQFSGDDAQQRLVEWVGQLRVDGRRVPGRPPQSNGQSKGPERGANLAAISVECGLTLNVLRYRPELRTLLGHASAELGLEPHVPGRQPTPRFEPLQYTLHSKPEVIERLSDYIERRRRDSRGIPCWSELRGDMDGKINIPLIAAQIGIGSLKRHHHPEAIDLIEEAAAELGVEPGGMDTVISLDPATGRAWRARFGPNSVMVEAVHLRTACYVVCCYLSGMRDGEVMEIRRGAHSYERSADGVINRHRVRSVVSKGRSIPESTTWVVTEHVARALEVMEQLDGNDLVFKSLHGRVRPVNALRDHINRLGAGGPVAVPDVDGAPWRFDTRQFRRTLAWFIGAQPFGVWAGAVQFKHRSVRAAMNGIGPTVFEGYAGTTPSGFPTEVDLAKTAAADLYVETLAAAHAGGAASAGGGAKRINIRLEELRFELGEDIPFGSEPRVVDDQRRVAMLRSVSHNLFVGPLTDCFFDRDVALCLQDQERSTATTPIIGRCQPNSCRNSRIGVHHLPAREERLAQVRADLRIKDVPPLQRRHLTDQRDRLKNEIAVLLQNPDHADGDSP